MLPLRDCRDALSGDELNEYKGAKINEIIRAQQGVELRSKAERIPSNGSVLVASAKLVSLDDMVAPHFFYAAPNRRQAGFTLIELMVVVSIIALLAGLLVPTISWVRTRAQQTACQNRLSQLGAAVRIYAELEGGRAPASKNWGDDRPEHSSAWFNRLPRLVSERKVTQPGTMFQCPAFNGVAPGLISNEVPKSYKMNKELDQVRASTRGYRHQPFFMNRISDGASVILFVDGITSGGKGQWGYAGAKEVDDSRHRGWVSVLFADGHAVRTLATAETQAGSKTIRWLSVDWQ